MVLLRFAVVLAAATAAVVVSPACRRVCEQNLWLLVRISCPDTGLRRIEAEAAPQPRGMRLVVVNRAMLSADGSGPVRNVDLNPVPLVWLPLALVLALAFMQPLSWKRRCALLVLGWLATQAIGCGVLWVAIAANSAHLGLVPADASWVGVAEKMVPGLLQFGWICGPGLSWLLVTGGRLKP
jgi:hypothetical protein